MVLGPAATEAPVATESESVMKAKYGPPDERPWQVKLNEASKGWGWFGVIIQGILLNKALSNLSNRRGGQEN